MERLKIYIIKPRSTRHDGCLSWAANASTARLIQSRLQRITGLTWTITPQYLQPTK